MKALPPRRSDRQRWRRACQHAGPYRSYQAVFARFSADEPGPRWVAPSRRRAGHR